MRPNRLEFDLYISPDGEEYRFNNQTDKFVIAGVSELGLPPINYRTQRGPFQDGQTVLGFTLEPRIITFVHRRNGECRSEFWDNRSDILNLLRPNRQVLGTFGTGIFRKILPDRTKRDLSVFIQGGLGFIGSQENRWDEFGFTQALQFVAHDPTLFNPTASEETFALGTQEHLVFPITFDTGAADPGIQFGSTDLNFTIAITYTGTWKAFPIITLTGPITNPIISNAETNEMIRLNQTILAGEVITINLEFGNKTVTDAIGTNFIENITSDSDLATFHLAPDPEVIGGVNTINVQGANVSVGVTAVSLTYNTRYIGI